jgi:hypothetical protein
MRRTLILSPIFRGHALALTMVFAVVTANAQITVGGGKTMMTGEINIGMDIPSIETTVFSCAPVQPFKKGQKIPGIFEMSRSGNKTWSSSTYTYSIDVHKVVYPIAAIVPSSDGTGHTVFAAIFKAKTDIKAGGELRIDGYEVKTSQPIRSGESIPVLYVAGNENIACLSIEPTRPSASLSVFKENLKSSDRASAIETWRIEKNYVEHTK